MKITWPKAHIGQAAPRASSPQQQQPPSAQRRPSAAAARLRGKGQHRALEGAWKIRVASPTGEKPWENSMGKHLGNILEESPQELDSTNV